MNGKSVGRHENGVMAFGLDISAAVLPPLSAMKGLFQGKPMQPEGDLWDHTLLVLDLLPAKPSWPK